MTTQAQPLTRVFKYGLTELTDPAPDLAPDEAIRLYGTGYPLLKSASLAEPVVEGDRLVYEVIKPQAKTKG